MELIAVVSLGFALLFSEVFASTPVDSLSPMPELPYIPMSSKSVPRSYNFELACFVAAFSFLVLSDIDVPYLGNMTRFSDSVISFFGTFYREAFSYRPVKLALFGFLFLIFFPFFVKGDDYLVEICVPILPGPHVAGCPAFPFWSCKLEPTIFLTTYLTVVYWSAFIFCSILLYVLFGSFLCALMHFGAFEPISKIWCGWYVPIYIDLTLSAHRFTDMMFEAFPIPRKSFLWFYRIVLALELFVFNYSIHSFFMLSSHCVYEWVALSPYELFAPIPLSVYDFLLREPLRFLSQFWPAFPYSEFVPLMPDRYLVPRDRRRDVKKFSISTIKSFSTWDYDFNNNSISYSKASSQKVKFFGRTILDGRTYSFPSHGCRRSFITFVLWMENNISYNDRAYFIVEGVCTPEIMRGYRLIYNPLKAERQFAESTFVGLAPELAQVEWACLAVGVAFHSYNRDAKSLAILLGSHATLAPKICAVCGVNNLADLVNFLLDIFRKKSDRSDIMSQSNLDRDLRVWFVSEDDDEATELSDSQIIALSPMAVLSLFPEAIKRSPLITKLVTLVTVIACASFSTNGSYIPAVLKTMDWTQITERAFCAALLTQVLMMVWKGLVAFSESGSYLDFLGVPAETKFMRESSALLYAVDKPLPVQDVRMNISKAADLIRSRDYLVGTNHVIDRTVVELRKYIKNQLDFLTALEPRVEPVIIFLKGEPGSGKTTLINALRSYLNAKDKVVTYPGEFVSYNIYDKFPVETGAHSCARFLILNDIASDYSDFPKNDLEPLDILMQKAIDTCTLSFRSAAVEDKGRVFNSIKYIIVTTNHDKYKFSSDSTKLIRRFEPGVFVTVDFKRGDFGDNKFLSDTQRNASIVIRPLKFSIKNKHMNLLPSAGHMSYRQFFEHVGSKVDDHFQYAVAQYKKLFATDSMCPCGVPKLMHYEDLNYIGRDDLDETVQISPLWNRINDLCVDPNGLLTQVALSPVAMFVGGSLFALSLPFLAEGWNSLKTLYRVSMNYGFELAISGYLISSRCNNEFLRLCGRRSSTVAACYELEYKAIEFMVSLAKFVRKYSRPIAMFFSAAVIGSFMWSYFNKSSEVPLGGGMSRFTVDEASMYTTVVGKPQEYQPSNLRQWARTDPVVHFELVTKGVGRDDLINLCRSAMADATFSYIRDGGVATFMPKVVFLSPDFVAVNRHYFQNEEGALREETMVTIGGVARMIKGSDLIDVPGSEMVLIKNTWRPYTANLIPKFANHDHKFGATIDLTVLYTDRGNFETPAYSNSVSLFGVSYPTYAWREEGKKGDCGTLAISRVNGDWFIAGFVAYGEAVRSKIISTGITIVSKDNFPTAIALGYPLVQETLVPHLPRNLVKLSENSEFVQQPNLYMVPYGSTIGGTNHFKSQITKTKLYDEVSSKFSVPYSYPDRISRTVQNEDGTRTYFSAWRSTFKYIDLPNLSEERVRLDAMDAYIEDCLLAIGDKKVELHPLSLFEAFWGHESLRVDGVVMKTSLGVTWREQGYRDKHDLFKLNPETQKFEAIPEFVQSVQRLIDDLKKGIIQAPLVDFVPKDEVRPLDKIKSCKIRLFSVLDFDLNAVFRMFAMPIINFLLDNPEFSECYGAMNAGSKQWTKLAQRLRRFNFFTDFDFSSFDTSHDVIFLTLVALFFFRISLRLGYTYEEASMLYLITRSLSFQVVKYLCDYFGKIKGMPSGVIITLILNSIINSILMRMAFIVLLRHLSVKKFRDYVAAATVGDDNVSGISGEIIELYNPIAVKPLYEKWGYVVTPASKGTDFQKHIPFEDLVFLKRKFVLWDDGWYRAPLDKDSLYKALAFQGSSPLSMSERLINVYDSMVREAYMHGRAFFEEYYGWIRELFVLHRLAVRAGEESEPGMAKPYHFENLNEIFLAGTMVTFMC